jgi:hypothetical protein
MRSIINDWVDDWYETSPWYDEITHEQEDRPIRSFRRPEDEEDEELVGWTGL